MNNTTDGKGLGITTSRPRKPEPTNEQVREMTFLVKKVLDGELFSFEVFNGGDGKISIQPKPLRKKI